MAGPSTPHAIWAAVMRTQSRKGRKVLKEYREGLWTQRQMATAPPPTVTQNQMLRQVKTERNQAVSQGQVRQNPGSRSSSWPTREHGLPDPCPS